MKTKFPFEINIDEAKFKLEYRELKKSEARALNDELGELKDTVETIKNLEREIALLEEAKEIKKEVASCLEGKAKANALQDVLGIIDEISTKQKEIKEADKFKIDVDETAKKRFDLTLSGEDVEAFKAEIEEKGLNYIDVMRAIDAVIEKERSKK